MSDRKRNEEFSEMDKQALFELLQRLERRDALHRNPFANLEQDLLLTEISDEEEEIRLDPVPYQPDLILAEESDGDLLIPLMSDGDLQDLLLFDDEDSLSAVFADHEPDDVLPPAPTHRRNPFAVLWGGFTNNFPRRGDSTGTKVRKCGFLTSLLVMLVAIVYLVVDLLIIPAQNEKLKQELISLYHPEKSNVIITKEEAQLGNYPENMLASFVELYQRNKDVRGWISFHATGNKDFLDIEYPIVYSGDNTEYLRKDFDGNKNRNGTLFFDQVNKVNSYQDTNRSLIVYGHNMASGQMFAGLNKLLGSVSNARAAATLSMSTLFRADEYKVFAVILTDESDKKKGRYFNTRRTSFADADDFLNYIEQMRDRSLFDYPVDVQADDDILVLSTCTGKSSAHVKDGRLVVVARRVRDGESAAVTTSEIQKNKDVIMPYYWYINQGKTPHEYYTQHGLTSESDLTTKPTSTTTAATTTTTTTGTGTDTTTGTDTDATVSTNADGTTTATVGGDTPATTKPTGGTSSSTTPTAGGDTTSTGTTATEGGDSTTPTAGGDSTTPTDATTDGDSTTAGEGDSTTAATESTETTAGEETTTTAGETTTTTEAPTTTTTESEPTTTTTTQPTEPTE